jgi:hypothetical protein
VQDLRNDDAKVRIDMLETLLVDQKGMENIIQIHAEHHKQVTTF